MTHMTRRSAFAALACVCVPEVFARGSRLFRVGLSAPDFATIERGVAGRLGVAVFDAASGRRLAWRADERFPMCSTFKWLLAAQVLSRVDAGLERSERVLPYGERDLLDFSSVTRANVGRGGLPVLELAAAAVSHSDNTAANLLLNASGGPASLTRYLRELGDPLTRLDRMEPELNSATPGDARDTTTPHAMLENMQRLLLAGGLGGDSRAKLVDWLVASVTGAGKLRAGLPSTWRVGDKTGMGGHGSTNDVAIAWPPGREPLLIASYLTETAAPVAARNGALAELARQVAGWAGEA
jgi:beta-lactamase class A